ncbi:MAG TPA: EAL domain-containing protein [Gaiellaceae bacterium]|jgi:diguanylate cyclase (GGDEF)-like protein|nr:EAL domain-containing protein [Gaiellaceae bacterium]
MLRVLGTSVVAIVLAGAGVVMYTGRYAIDGAEANASAHTSFVARTIARQNLWLTDFQRPVSASRRAALDRLFEHQVLIDGALRVKLYSPTGLVTYSNAHDLIGTRPGEQTVEHVFRTQQPATDVTHLRDEGGTGPNTQALETYAPMVMKGKRVGVLEIYQDYGPVAAAAWSTFWPVAAVSGVVLCILYISLFPLLRRVTRRLRRQVEEIEHQAMHDSLTGLPNRVLFRDRVEQALHGAKRRTGEVAVMFLDLDRFKEVNDTLGHESGDVLLREVGQRLAHSLRAGDTVARLGGDEFAVLATGLDDADDALLVARKLRQSVEWPFTLRGLTLEVETSIGIALFPEHGTDADTLLRHADVAMYQCKEAHSGVGIYSPERDVYSPDRLKLLGELRRAIEQNELVLYYQPKVSLRTSEVTGFEALVRWQHPEQGLLTPERFIPFAEHTGLVKPLTRYVMREAVRACAKWQERGLELGVAVNLSARDLLDLHLPDEVRLLLSETRIDPGCLELEITENTILSDPARTRTILNRLKELGVRLAIDDFGSGYSSLGYLKRLPLDVLKIDKSFVMTMLADDDSAAIVRSTIDLAHNLGLEVVAEGVATESIGGALAALRCDSAQGFYFAGPMPESEAASWAAEVASIRASALEQLSA